MVYPEVPFAYVVFLPILFIFLITFTNIRYNFSPEFHISNSTAFSSLVVAFILLYAMQKYDNMDLNVPTVNRGLLYLKELADKYDPRLTKYLISYAKGFLCLETDNYSLFYYERDIFPLLDTPTERERVKEIVNTLEDIYNQRVSLTNTIAQPIWYLVFITAIILTIIFPMDDSLNRIDAVLVLILIWLPLTVIYGLYLSEIETLKTIMKDTINTLQD